MLTPTNQTTRMVNKYSENKNIISQKNNSLIRLLVKQRNNRSSKTRNNTAKLAKYQNLLHVQATKSEMKGEHEKNAEGIPAVQKGTRMLCDFMWLSLYVKSQLDLFSPVTQ